MNTAEFKKVSRELQELCKGIPLHWGAIQNDETDSKLNLFKIHSKEQLENNILEFKQDEKNYYRRRWFLWQCAKVDEYLFYQQNNVRKNPNRKDKDWDIEFQQNESLRFDIKSTIIPKIMRPNFKVKDEEKIIEFYYQNQSKGIRNHLQNRLFIVHHSFYKPERSLVLRCHWNLKQKAFVHFNKIIGTDINFTAHKTVIAKCIFIFEYEKNVFHYTIT